MQELDSMIETEEFEIYFRQGEFDKIILPNDN